MIFTTRSSFCGVVELVVGQGSDADQGSEEHLTLGGILRRAEQFQQLRSDGGVGPAGEGLEPEVALGGVSEQVIDDRERSRATDPAQRREQSLTVGLGGGLEDGEERLRRALLARVVGADGDKRLLGVIAFRAGSGLEESLHHGRHLVGAAEFPERPHRGPAHRSIGVGRRCHERRHRRAGPALGEDIDGQSPQADFAGAGHAGQLAHRLVTTQHDQRPLGGCPLRIAGRERLLQHRHFGSASHRAEQGDCGRPHRRILRPPSAAR
jgi:hypothetical protein